MTTHQKIEPKAGRVLISEPHLNDYYFSRSVVLLADHNTDGSFGLIINKPLPTPFNELVKGFPDFHAQVFLGGPVQSDALFFIHTLGDKLDGSSRIMDGIFWGGELEQVKDMIRNGSISASEIMFFVGYSGWSPNQLEEELERHSWLVSDANAADILNTDTSALWMRYLRNMGDEYAIWSNFPADPILN